MSNCCAIEARDRQQRKLLWVVLVLNATMFVVEFVAGWVANSSGLLADSLDMLADALVYSLSLCAVGKGLREKARSALLNGSLQLALGIGVLVSVAWRIWTNSAPSAEVMGVIATLALLVNAICFALLYKFRAGDMNMRASWICSRNDMLANVGVLVAAALVSLSSSPWPDWIIAILIAAVVIRSALTVIKEARKALASGGSVSLGCCDDD